MDGHEHLPFEVGDAPIGVYRLKLVCLSLIASTEGLGVLGDEAYSLGLSSL